MVPVDMFSEDWNRLAAEEEAKLGGIRIGPLKPLGTSGSDNGNERDDDETLKQEEDMLRQKLASLLEQMKGREADGREYLRKHGIAMNLDVPDRSGVYA